MKTPANTLRYLCVPTGTRHRTRAAALRVAKKVGEFGDFIVRREKYSIDHRCWIAV